MTNAISIRKLEIKMNSDGMYCLNDLHKASGGDEKDKPSNWLATKQVKELEEEILNAGNPAIKKSAGRYGGTYVCKELVYAYAMWISAKFHLEVIRVFDQQTQAKTELDCLVDNVRSASSKLDKQLDKASLSLTELKSHGQSWGVYGASIRKAKKEAVKELEDLKDKIQYKLDLM